VHFAKDCFPDLLEPRTSASFGLGRRGVFGVLSAVLGVPPEGLLADAFADPTSLAMALGNTADAAAQVKTSTTQSTHARKAT